MKASYLRGVNTYLPNLSPNLSTDSVDNKSATFFPIADIKLNPWFTTIFKTCRDFEMNVVG